jgi:hypothetical protein
MVRAAAIREFFLTNAMHPASFGKTGRPAVLASRPEQLRSS